MFQKSFFIAFFIGLFFSMTVFAQKTENREAKNFNVIAVAGSFKVYLKQEDTEGVALEGSEEDLERMIVEVESGKLKIHTKPNSKIGKVTVRVDYKNIKACKVAGSADVVFETEHSGGDMELDLAGSGTIKGTFKTENLVSKLAGSGDMFLSGKTNRQKISLAGSGAIKSADLEAQDCKADIAGSGDVYVHAVKNLTAVVAGSGDVRYKGSPENVEAKVAGSGTISKIK